MQSPQDSPQKNLSSGIAFRQLLDYCRANDWAGYEPYDALNSAFFKLLPFLNSRLPRLVLTQTLKRSPINVRRLLLIPKTQNPKALGLFLSGIVRVPDFEEGEREELTRYFVKRLVELRSQDTPYWCWGYNFPWQTRTVLVPKWTPNLVCTSFAANGLLDAYERYGNPEYLNIAASAAQFILNELYWTEGGAPAGFGYPLPTVRNQVHNANFLGAALLARVYKRTGDEKFLAPALKVARYSAAKQKEDGSWDYGEAPTQRWIDNFHTGFNLSALQFLGKYLDTTEFESCVRRGFDFYRSHFFLKSGAVKYFHNQTYPLDAHCFAQSIITLVDLKHLDPDNLPTAQRVFQWSMDHLWDPRGFFYYRKLRSCTIRTSYMRWTQAWMFLALSTLHSESNGKLDVEASGSSTSCAEASAR